MANNVRKLTDKQFLAVLRANGGLFARTARAISEQYKINYTRQSVRDRAEKFPDEVADIAEEIIDVAEDGLQDLMESENETVKLKAIELYLKTKGKKRGYVEKQEVDLNVSKIEVEFI